MARVTKAQKIEIANERAALESFEQMLAGLPDPRRTQGMRYPLRSVGVIALMAIICTCDNAESMEDWGSMNEEWLGELLDLPHGVPSQDVYLSVFASLGLRAFSEVFRTWASWVEPGLVMYQEILETFRILMMIEFGIVMKVLEQSLKSLVRQKKVMDA